MRSRRVGAILTGITLLVAGCTSANDDGSSGTGSVAAPLVHAASLERFDACPELLGYLRENAADRVGPYGLPGGMSGVLEDFAMEGGERAAAPTTNQAADSAGGAAGGSFSGTNVQEASVDEPDKVKTNGDHIFTTHADPETGRLTLIAVATDGGRPRRVGSVALPEGAGADLLLAGDRLLAFGMGGMAFGRGAAVDMAYPAGGGQGTTVTIVDVGDPVRMRVADVVKLDGSYTSARMVGGIVRMVVNTWTGQRVDFAQPEQPTAVAAREAISANKKVVRETKIEDWLPRFAIEDASGKVRTEGPLTTCDSTFRPKAFSGFSTTSVVTIDPAKPDPRDSASVLGSGGTVYASADNLYVATMNWEEPRPLPVEDGGGPDAPMIAPVDPAKTLLHRFDISDTTRAQYAASGEVRGSVLNQWSLSEHGGHLRVATTEDTGQLTKEGVPSTSSYVTTFRANDAKLTQVGQISNLGKGERIYGVRFIGDVGYVVTFRQVDPLHVIDLSDAAKPRLLGELKIPGYSAYLHPVGDGLLLGVGQDVDEETSRQLGTQLSLFDVSDPAKPTRIDQVRVDNASTPIEWDHHAFTWWEARRLAIVPVSRYGEVIAEPVAPDGREIAPQQIESLHVAIGYTVADGKLTEVGRASHRRHVSEEGLAQIDRSIVIGDAVFTLSQAGVMSNDIGSFDERGWAAF
jgi:hypothetical protein